MKRVIASIVIGVIIGCISTLIGISIYYGSLNDKVSYGVLEWMYYLTQPVGVLATTFAVVVALFGKEIRAFFFNERCTPSLINAGFYENLGRDVSSPNPTAHCYDCVVKLTNEGSRQIEKCELILKEVHYKVNPEGKFKRLFSSEHKALYWDVREVKDISLFIGESRSIPLFKIYPESSCQTPDGDMSSPLCMKVIGCTMQPQFTHNGIWKASYEIRSVSKVLSKFELTAEWDGVWCNRSREMDDHVSANLKIVKK